MVEEFVDVFAERAELGSNRSGCARYDREREEV